VIKRLAGGSEKVTTLDIEARHACFLYCGARFGAAKTVRWARLPVMLEVAVV